MLPVVLHLICKQYKSPSLYFHVALNLCVVVQQEISLISAF